MTIKDRPGGETEATEQSNTRASVNRIPQGYQSISGNDDFGLYLDALYGDAEGFLCVAIGSGPCVSESGKYEHDSWREVALQHPADTDAARDLLLGAAETVDVYLCPYLMAGPKRHRGGSVRRPLVHSEVDCEIDIEKVSAVGGFAVSSGSPGHAHVYVPLTESVSPAHHRQLCRALRVYLGAKDSKIADNDLLRPPATFNHKLTVMDGGGGAPAPVEWLLKPTGNRIDSSKLAELLDVELADDTATNGTAGPVWDDEAKAVPNLPLRYPNLTAALEKNTGDRSADTMRIAKACKNDDLTLSQTRWVIDQRPDLRERLDGRKDDDVARCYERAGCQEGVDGSYPTTGGHLCTPMLLPCWTGACPNRPSRRS